MGKSSCVLGPQNLILCVLKTCNQLRRGCIRGVPCQGVKISVYNIHRKSRIARSNWSLNLRRQYIFKSAHDVVWGGTALVVSVSSYNCPSLSCRRSERSVIVRGVGPGAEGRLAGARRAGHGRAVGMGLGRRGWLLHLDSSGSWDASSGHSAQRGDGCGSKHWDGSR